MAVDPAALAALGGVSGVARDRAVCDRVTAAEAAVDPAAKGVSGVARDRAACDRGAAV